MYDQWQRAAEQTNLSGKKFAKYLKCIRSILLEFDNVGAPNETQLIYRTRKSFRSKIRPVFHNGATVPKAWLTSLKAGA